ncbi:uncharacterized protein LOC113237625 [Hyposmocoma kahamanoa]|uniref:uncharacterized protein LOC113237625 n=1 Tax=Hyposmocoma kahamanoa TaxID=1477025 RepID=UPI000E6D8F61|nr:uncharacterized protein LOC113237625 [Hyposmocoma kahamanoa]
MSEGEPSICRVGVKIPPFWPDKPTLWFAQLEGQFALANVTTDATKFYHVISVLEPKYAADVEDIITKPLSTEKYEKLKSELISRLSSTRAERWKQLIFKEELGDRNPSQFLRHIRSLAGPECPDEFLRNLWTTRLPSLLQSIIAMQDNLSLDAVAQMADKVHEVTPNIPTSHVAATSTSQPPLS